MAQCKMLARREVQEDLATRQQVGRQGQTPVEGDRVHMRRRSKPGVRAQEEQGRLACRVVIQTMCWYQVSDRRILAGGGLACSAKV